MRGLEEDERGARTFLLLLRFFVIDLLRPPEGLLLGALMCYRPCAVCPV